MKNRTSKYSINISTILILAMLVFFRNPSCLLDAQFWGEDGWFWYPDARHYGLRSLLLPHTGYLQTDDRIFGLLGTLIPFHNVPLLFACAAFVFQLLPALYLASDRCKNLCQSKTLRLALAALLCVMPNTWEVYVNLTNSQWHLALLAFLVICADKPTTRKAWAFDIAALTLSGLSGPFSVLLIPVAVLACRGPNKRVALSRLAIVGACALVQGSVILADGARVGSSSNLGASLSLFVRIIAAQIVSTPLIGRYHLPGLEALHSWKNGLLPWGVTLLAFRMIFVAFRRFPTLRLPLVFAALVGYAGLTHPVGIFGMPAWQAFLHPDSSQRYLFIPICIWLCTVTCLTLRGPLDTRICAILYLVTALLVGIQRDYHFTPESDRGFYNIARQFEAAPPGTPFTLPVRPGSSMTLVR